MRIYIIKRFLMMLGTIFIIASLTFLLMHLTHKPNLKKIFQAFRKTFHLCVKTQPKKLNSRCFGIYVKIKKLC